MTGNTVWSKTGKCVSCQGQGAILGVSKPTIQPSLPPSQPLSLAPPLSQYWEKTRETPSLYALFKHTYNAQIFTNKFSDVIQPLMNIFFEKKSGLITQKTLF